MAEVGGNGFHDKPSSRLPTGARDRNLGSGLGESRVGKPDMRSGTHMGGPRLWANSWNTTAEGRAGKGPACHQKEGPVGLNQASG